MDKSILSMQPGVFIAHLPIMPVAVFVLGYYDTTVKAEKGGRNLYRPEVAVNNIFH